MASCPHPSTVTVTQPLSQRIARSTSSMTAPQPAVLDVPDRPTSYRTYNEEQLLRAYEAVMSKTMSTRRAAEFGVPRSTLQDRVAGRDDTRGGTIEPCKLLYSSSKAKGQMQPSTVIYQAWEPLTTLQIPSLLISLPLLLAQTSPSSHTAASLWLNSLSRGTAKTTLRQPGDWNPQRRTTSLHYPTWPTPTSEPIWLHSR